MSKIELIQHRVVRGPLGPIQAQMMEYLWAKNGIFVRAKRSGLEGRIRIGDCETKGLEEVEECVRMDYPHVPLELTRRMFDLAWSAGADPENPLEILFRFWWDGEGARWMLDVPMQEQSIAFCKPMSREFPNTLIEIHSHHRMDAWFSRQDNKDEQGFRLYGVMGEFEEKPILRMRLGIFGHYRSLPAEDFLELPERLHGAGREEEP